MLIPLPILDYLTRGGWVLWIVFGLTSVMLTLLSERFTYLVWHWRKRHRKIITLWRARTDRSSWRAHKVRETLLAREQAVMETGFPVIKGLIAICPLTGLLGTVTGMITLFERMGYHGLTVGPMLLESLSRITLPTLAGILVTIVGVYAYTWCLKLAERRQHRLADALTLSDPATNLRSANAG
ncbi:MAG: hypothetical protein B0D91_12200 [Oceanospirillales bacterium LUC14_002_19_P2]|nr:MAG: hypothetical protein B0D91_12200 [Oceanospirillales bacterium LUC14_002_19_P2]